MHVYRCDKNIILLLVNEKYIEFLLISKQLNANYAHFKLVHMPCIYMTLTSNKWQKFRLNVYEWVLMKQDRNRDV